MKKLSLLLLTGLAQLSFAQDMQLRKLLPNENILIGATVNQWLVASDLGKPDYNKKASTLTSSATLSRKSSTALRRRTA